MEESDVGWSFVAFPLGEGKCMWQEILRADAVERRRQLQHSQDSHWRRIRQRLERHGDDPRPLVVHTEPRPLTRAGYRFCLVVYNEGGVRVWRWVAQEVQSIFPRSDEFHEGGIDDWREIPSDEAPRLVVEDQGQ